MRVPPPLWLFSRAWRRRYGREVLDMYASSARPVADWFDLLRAGSVALLEDTMRSRLACLLLAACAAFIAAAGYTTTQLAEGIRETPHHWWSTAPYVALGLALIALAATVASRRAAPDS
jgi:hypothetical protein